MAEQAQSKTTRMKSGSGAKISFHDMLSVVSMIHDHNEIDNLVAASKQANATISVPAKTVNIVKDLIANHPAMSTQALGMNVTNPPKDANDPTLCCGFIRR